MTRVLLFGLLAVVAMAAAVLSFSALRDLGLACGFDPRLAWLVPIVVDAGAAAGSVSWLSQPSKVARSFGRRLAVVLLVASVIGNGIAHLLEAYDLEAAWWLVVAVSALAPCVLGAVVHLVVLTVQDDTEDHEQVSDASARFPEAGTARGAHDLSTHEYFPAPGTRTIFGDPRKSQVGQPAAGDNPDLGSTDEPTVGQEPTVARAAELIAEGAGRRRLSKELGITEYEARQLMNGRINGNGATS